MQTNVYQHFRKDEHPFIESVLDWIDQVTAQYAPIVTDFLNPREKFIVESLVNGNLDIECQFYGGFEESERKCAILYPNYYTPSIEDFEIKIFEISYPTKFCDLTHGKILGTIINKGIKRECIGDIITDGEKWQIFMKKSIANYVVIQTEKISNVSIRFIEIELNDVMKPIEDWMLENHTISSLRIDNLVSSVYNISRQRSKKLIESGKVQLNWTPIERPDLVADIKDIVSVRGFGRIQLEDIQGKTRKDKIRIAIRCLRK
ncbi:YlmH family RNA-binding protein [Vagococcus silagei]|uniref:RNA-binding protein n=1 Tax=Vagococcus silagei TaxID=2508885 RepID=A0A4S3B7T5_9ENTE|nr:RNA-binding protein [Vagococcus silagei]THB60845.1 RNA-binding protein [Vagococcus silagei]